VEEEEEEAGLTGSHQTGFGASRARDLAADLGGFPRAGISYNAMLSTKNKIIRVYLQNSTENFV